MPERDETFFLNMENGSTIMMNGHVNNHSFVNGPDSIKALSNSKISLHSLRSNASSNISNKIHMNGYSSSHSLDKYDEKKIHIKMESTDRRFGFSVMGGIDEGFPPKIDTIADGSPAERAGLQLEDEIIEVNNLNIETQSHTEIIRQIHNCKKDILLTVKRYPSENGIHEMPIDVPPSYRDRENNNSYIRRTTGEPSSEHKIDGMLKFTRTQPKAESTNRDSNVPSKFVNLAFQRDEDDETASVDQLDISREHHDHLQKSISLSQFVTMLEVMKTKVKGPRQQENMDHLRNLLNNAHFQSSVKAHNRLTRIQAAKKTLQGCHPVATNSSLLLNEVRVLLMENVDSSSTALLGIINKPDFKELLNCHDNIAVRESLDYFPEDSGSEESDYDPEDPKDDIASGEEQRVRIVRIDKTNEPLGATVKNEGDAVIISRIIKGGAADKTGVLHEGDEILEINDNSVRGKDINEVVELLSELEGTLTFVLVSGTGSANADKLRDEGIVVIKALFDYNHKDDEYLPCEELGLSFRKGDVLEILNTDDQDWWQAQLMNSGERKGLAGLIPSKPFQLKRELAKITLKNEDQEPIFKEKNKRCWCGRARRKGKKVPMKSNMMPVNEAEVLTYEDMVRIFPDRNRRRPVVLIGPSHVGRREIREQLIGKFSERFAAAVPHTTRPPNEGEESGVDYTFVTRAQFEKSIAAAEFIEHGLFDNHYYGTSFSAVRNVVQSGKTCLLNMHCQALAVLKTSNLLPYVVFLTVPRIDQLKRLREFDDTGEPFNPNVRLKDGEIDDMIELARDMQRTNGHNFDKTIVNTDLDKAYDEVLKICDYLDTEPQWVPSSWVR